MPSITPSLLPEFLSTCRIDGIDLSQLLRDIGEATVSTDPLELFRLCLAAQRVLLADLDNAGAEAKGEPALLVFYRAMNFDGRDRLRSFARHLQKRFPCPTPAPSLVKTGQHVSGGAA